MHCLNKHCTVSVQNLLFYTFLLTTLHNLSIYMYSQRNLGNIELTKLNCKLLLLTSPII